MSLTTAHQFKEWFADELAELMKENDLQPYHIALLCMVDVDAVIEYLNGETLPDPWQLVLLAETFNCSVNDLLGFGEVAHPIVYEPYLASDIFIDGSSFAVRLAERIKVHMHNRNMSGEKLSQELKINVRIVRSWFTTRPTLPTTLQLIYIAEVLDCTPSDLLGY